MQTSTLTRCYMELVNMYDFCMKKLEATVTDMQRLAYIMHVDMCDNINFMNCFSF